MLNDVEPTVFERAARGDLAAQREAVAASLNCAQEGLSDWRSATEHAMLMARLAYWNSGQSDDLRQMVQMLNLCVQHALERDDFAAFISYSAEFAARVDELADLGDESAADSLCNNLSKLDPSILNLSKQLREFWARRNC